MVKRKKKAASKSAAQVQVTISPDGSISILAPRPSALKPGAYEAEVAAKPGPKGKRRKKKKATGKRRRRRKRKAKA